ncbi:MAG: glycosyltransferase [Bacteroidetes bacterium]|nr:glycosyltransferase [Bacteroidota bacterium]
MSERRPKIICFGPGPAFKGGISNYNTSLALALDKEGADVHIVSWTQQYPAIIPRDFKDRASKSDLLEGTQIKVSYLTNYNNPFSWKKTVDFIKSLNPDKVIFQWAIAIQGLPMGYIAKRLYKWRKTEVIFDCHLVVQKEGSSLDKFFTRMGLSHAHTYLAHAYKTVNELKATFPKLSFSVNENGKRAPMPNHTVIKLYHPVYDMFKPKADFDTESVKKQMGLKKNVFLFFGFIRKYKGLHQAISAFDLVCKQRDDVSLLIVGESFWNTLPKNTFGAKFKKLLFGIAKKIFLKKSDDEQDYNPLAMVEELGLQQDVVVVNEFVPNEDVHKYFQVSDTIVLFYLTATPSGVESLSYNFQLPVLATKVGHFPETIEDGFNGYLAEDKDINDMANVMLKAIDKPIPRDNIKKSAEKLSWANYAKAILVKD